MLSNEMIKILAVTVALLMIVKGCLRGRLIERNGVVDRCADALAYLSFIGLLLAFLYNSTRH